MNSLRLGVAFVVTLLWAVSLSARDDGGPKYKAPPEIVATLPKICWWLYMDNVPNTPEYNTLDCGVNYNHYCPGLVELKQAERERTTEARLGRLRHAKDSMEYTLRNTEAFPECSLRQPAKMNLERVKFQIDMLKLKAPKR